MSINAQDIKKLASLSRIKISDSEVDQFAKEIDGILGYVEQIKEVSGGASGGAMAGFGAPSHAGKSPLNIPHRNQLREDADDRSLNDDASILVESAPQSEDGYIKVKKILG